MVYLRNVDSSTLLPSTATSNGWHINWSATTSRYDVEAKYYFFNGQRVAMRVNGVITYLHADHLGSTVLETTAGGAPGADQRYFA